MNTSIFTLIALIIPLSCVYAYSSEPNPNSVPRLNGTFIEIYHDMVDWSEEDWKNEFTAMQNVGIHFAVIRAISTGYYPNYTVSDGLGIQPDKDCLCGYVTYTYFPTQLSPSKCFQQVGTKAEGGIAGTLLRAATALSNFEVHIGLVLMPIAVEDLTEYHELSRQILGDFWENFKSYRPIIPGIYSIVEIGNAKGAPHLEFLHKFLCPICSDVKAIDSTLQCWSSPYFTANHTMHTEKLMTAKEYADFWYLAFKLCPSFDFIAPQDSMGAQGNNFEEVHEYLSAMADASRKNKRAIWSNIESFASYNCTCCPLSDCSANCGRRRPGPFDRITHQFANERPLVDLLITWEWHAYLSPYSAVCDWSGLAHEQYKRYKAYVGK